MSNLIDICETFAGNDRYSQGSFKSLLVDYGLIGKQLVD